MQQEGIGIVWFTFWLLISGGSTFWLNELMSMTHVLPGLLAWKLEEGARKDREQKPTFHGCI